MVRNRDIDVEAIADAYSQSDKVRGVVPVEEDEEKKEENEETADAEETKEEGILRFLNG